MKFPINNYSIFESGSGGQLFVQNNDIQKSGSLGMMVYLKLFGGNIEASTVKENKVGDIRLDWWGNDSSKNKSTWINSETERTLQGITINSGAIIKISESVIKDLDSLKKYGDITVDVTFPLNHRIQLDIKIVKVDSKEDIRLVWDATVNEVIQAIIL